MQKQNEPQHVAIILDGNRRFAKRLMQEPWKGHEYGKKKVEELSNYAKDIGIKELTFYALSSENIKNRPKKELEFLFKLFKESFKEIDNNKLMENKIKIQFIGDLELLPDDLADLCFKLEEKTKKNNKFKINFAIAYGGRQELIKAVRKIIEEGINFEEINEEVIEEYLYLKDEPDLIIRTGGEKRTSNFLVWQSIYSEWFFLDKMWPEFEKEDLIKCIEEFKTRKRKFGG
ncbi:di-trans,poly-cis-decaprenylcistransferase [Candidatus Pacearchaeota archaeon]|nr:di-trans,poly-cis-decaprenylcistransferase [Candidatus Pacearchaeota archaeon]